MIYVFYLLGLVPLIFEINSAYDPTERLRLVGMLKKKKEQPPSIEERTFVLMNVFYMIWTVVGLITFQWALFLILFIMGLVPKRAKWHVILDSIVSIGIILFVMLNFFHFKINLF